MNSKGIGATTPKTVSSGTPTGSARAQTERKISGGRTFAGYGIDWWPGGKELDFFEKLKEYFKSFNSERANEIRDEFLSHIQEEIKDLLEMYQIGPQDRKIQNVKNLLTNINQISKEDLPEYKKAELILLAVEGDKSFLKLSEAQNAIQLLKEQTIDTINQTLQFKGALKTKDNKDKLDSKPIESLEDLVEFKKDYAESVINKMISLYGNNDELMNNLQYNINQLVEEKMLAFPEQQKTELKDIVAHKKNLLLNRLTPEQRKQFEELNQLIWGLDEKSRMTLIDNSIDARSLPIRDKNRKARMEEMNEIVREMPMLINENYTQFMQALHEEERDELRSQCNNLLGNISDREKKQIIASYIEENYMDIDSADKLKRLENLLKMQFPEQFPSKYINIISNEIHAVFLSPKELNQLKEDLNSINKEYEDKIKDISSQSDFEKHKLEYAKAMISKTADAYKNNVLALKNLEEDINKIFQKINFSEADKKALLAIARGPLLNDLIDNVGLALRDSELLHTQSVNKEDLEELNKIRNNFLQKNNTSETIDVLKFKYITSLLQRLKGIALSKNETQLYKERGIRFINDPRLGLLREEKEKLISQ